MGKLYLKNALFAALGIASALYLGACLKPVDMEAFLRDEKVQDIINRNKVGLLNYTGHNLTAGNQRITGLDPNRYYMVEILDEDGEPFTPQRIRFVNGSGNLDNNFNQIRRTPGGTINNLNNDLIYAVYSAPITGNMTLYELASPPPPTGTGITVTANPNGIITPSIPAPDDTYYLQFPPDIDTGCSILMFPVVPLANPNPVNFITGRIIELEGEGTTTDYVLYDAGDAVPLKFLRVSIEAIIPPVDFVINVAFEIIGDNGELLAFTPGSLSVSQDDLLAGGLTITVNGGSVPGFNPAGTEWWFGGALLHTGANFTMRGLDNIEYLVLGSKEFTVEFVIGAIRYSKILTVVVNY